MHNLSMDNHQTLKRPKTSQGVRQSNKPKNSVALQNGKIPIRSGSGKNQIVLSSSSVERASPHSGVAAMRAASGRLHNQSMVSVK